MLRTWAEPWRGEPRAALRASATLLAYLGGLVLGGVLFHAAFTHGVKPRLVDPAPWLREWVQLLLTGWMFASGLLLFLGMRRWLSAPQRRVSLWQARAGRPDWRWAALAGGLWLGLLLTTTLVSDGTALLEARVAAHGPGVWALLLLTAVVCVGLQSTSEEIVFRGYLQPRLAVRLAPVFALLLTTLVFTVVHVGSGWWGGLGVFLIGLALGLSAWRSGSLMPAVGLHVANNLFQFLYDPHGTNADVGPLEVALGAVALALWLAWVEFTVRRARLD